MLLRHGRVVAEGWWAPYEAKLPHTLYSLSKSFTSIAVGFAVSEGRLRGAGPGGQLLSRRPPGDRQPQSRGHARQASPHMSTGHETEPMPAT